MKIASIGDSAVVLRPHLGSGAVNAIEAAFLLYENLQSKPSFDTAAINSWQAVLIPKYKELASLAKMLGQGTGDRSTFMDMWWDTLIADKRHVLPIYHQE